MPPRLSQSTLEVLRVLVDAEGRLTYGLEIGKAAGLASGTLYPILDRLTREGWAEASWEEVDPSEAGRPRRRYYRLTALGEVAAVRALQTAHARTTPRSWLKPAPTPGG
jgi:PadR family transcriptional regulator PadR